MEDPLKFLKGVKMLSNEEKEQLMQVVYSCAATGILRESLEMIEKSVKYALDGRTEEAEWADFVSEELQKLATQYHEKVTIV